MITFEQFFWLIHYLLIIGYSYEIVAYIYNRIHYGEVFEKAADIAPHIYERQWHLVTQGGVLTILAMHATAYGLAVKAVPLYLIILMCVFAFSGVRNEALKPYIKVYKRDHPKGTVSPNTRYGNFPLKKVLIGLFGATAGLFIGIGLKVAEGGVVVFAGVGIFTAIVIAGLLDKWRSPKPTSETNNNHKRRHENTESEGFANNSNTTDDDFGFDEKTWQGNGSARASTEKSKPYGTEKHHPDDETLWNVVNDPNAAEGEQLNALRAIKKKEAKRRREMGKK